MHTLKEQDIKKFQDYMSYKKFNHDVNATDSDFPNIDSNKHFKTSEHALAYEFVSNKIGLIDLNKFEHQSMLSASLIAQTDKNKIDAYKPDATESLLIIDMKGYVAAIVNVSKNVENFSWTATGYMLDMASYIPFKNPLISIGLSLGSYGAFYIADKTEIINYCIDTDILEVLDKGIYKPENAKQLQSRLELFSPEARSMLWGNICANYDNALNTARNESIQAEELVKQSYEEMKQLNQTYIRNIEHKLQYSKIFNKISSNSYNYDQDNIGELQSQVGTISCIVTDDIKDKVITKEQILAIEEGLKQNGIALEILSRDMYKLIQMNETSYNALAQIVNYLNEKTKEEQKLHKLEIRAAQCRGLNDTCNFVRQVAVLTNSKKLADLTTVIQAGIQVSCAVEQIINASSIFSLGLLTPYSAIGMAALAIFSLFQKSPEQDQNSIIRQQIAQISMQLSQLTQKIDREFGDVHSHLTSLLSEINKGFEKLNFTLNVPIARQLSQIQGEIHTLLSISKTGFIDLLSNDLNSTINLVEELKNQNISLNSIPYSKYAQSLSLLKDYLLNKSTNRLFNGSVYYHLLEDKPGYTHQLVELLSYDSDQLQNLLSLLVRYGKDNLKNSTFMKLEEKLFFHPEIWYLALRAYRDLNLMYGFKYNYDLKNRNLILFNQQINMLNYFTKILQTNEELYNTILDKIYNSIELLEKDITQKYIGFDDESGNLFSYFSNLADILKLFHKKNIKEPINPHYSFEIINKFADDRVALDESKKFFDPKNLSKLFIAEGKIPNPIFMIAERLGLGFFEYEFITPNNGINNEGIVKRSNGKYSLKTGYRTGFSITFITEAGQRWSLFGANSIFSDTTAYSLSSLYSLTIKSCTKDLQSEYLSAKMTQLVEQHLFRKQKEFCAFVTEYLNSNINYHNLLKLTHFFVAYLSCAGFPPSIIQDAKLILYPLRNLVSAYEEWAKNKIFVASFPFIEKCKEEGKVNKLPFITLKNLDQLRKSIIDLNNKANLDESYRNQMFISPLLAYIDFSLMHLKEIKILNQTKTARYFQLNGSTHLDQNISKFFNKINKDSQQIQQPQSDIIAAQPIKQMSKL